MKKLNLYKKNYKNKNLISNKKKLQIPRGNEQLIP